MLWKAAWALIFGYIISAAIQVLVTREQMARALGDRGPRQVGLAGLFGFITSSCSFAALAASRAIFAKGAHPVNALAFLIAATNLVIELGIVLWVLVGWRFTLANFLLGIVMILYAYVATRIWLPAGLARSAREHAQKVQQDEAPAEASARNGGWTDKLRSRRTWLQIAKAFVAEWKMVWKEILFGFTVAGFISVFVPQSFWNALFLKGTTGDVMPLWAVAENAAVAPFVAFFTFIGSMGNVPLAAMLWSRDVSFGGVMAFLGADLVAATVIWVHRKYYGWGYAAYLSLLLYVCMVLAGITVHYVFAALGAIPEERPALDEMVSFAVDHTFFLNLVFGAAAAVLLWIGARPTGGRGQPIRAHG